MTLNVALDFDDIENIFVFVAYAPHIGDGSAGCLIEENQEGGGECISPLIILTYQNAKLTEYSML